MRGTPESRNSRSMHFALVLHYALGGAHDESGRRRGSGGHDCLSGAHARSNASGAEKRASGGRDCCFGGGKNARCHQRYHGRQGRAAAGSGRPVLHSRPSLRDRVCTKAHRALTVCGGFEAGEQGRTGAVRERAVYVGVICACVRHVHACMCACVRAFTCASARVWLPLCAYARARKHHASMRRKTLNSNT